MPKPDPPPMTSQRISPSLARSTDSLEILSRTIFAPNLKPLRIVTEPRKPSLAGSKLAPPWAEIDERPTWRARRFKLWRDNAPGLLLAVLDPRRRGQLRRYQPYALPPIPPRTYGVQSIPVQLNPKPDPSLPTPKRPLVLPRTPYPWNPSAKIPKWQRKARYQRLLQYKWVLDQEHERRFRAGMRGLMCGVIEFESANLKEYAEWGDWPFRTDIDPDHVTARQLTQLFADIRKKSGNVYHHLKLAGIPIEPVPRREEVHKAVKAENKRREKKREKKEALRVQAEFDAATKAEEARVAREAEEKAFASKVERLGLGDWELAGELEELEGIRVRLANLSEVSVGGLMLAGELDELDEFRARLAESPRRFPSLDQSLSSLQVSPIPNTTHQHSPDHSIIQAQPKKRRSRRARPESSPARTHQSETEGDLTDATTLTVSSIPTPPDIPQRPPLHQAKTDTDLLASTPELRPFGPPKPELYHRSSAPAPNHLRQRVEDERNEGSQGRARVSFKRVTLGDASRPLATQDLPDGVAHQLVELLMAMQRSGPSVRSQGRSTGTPVDRDDNQGSSRRVVVVRRPSQPRTNSPGEGPQISPEPASASRSSNPEDSSKSDHRRSRRRRKPSSATSTDDPAPDLPTQDSEPTLPPQPKPHVSRLVNLDHSRASPPPPPARSLSSDSTKPRFSFTRASSPSVIHPAKNNPWAPGCQKDDLASLVEDLQVASLNEWPCYGDRSASESVIADRDLQTTQPPSYVSIPWGDLNMDEDTAALSAQYARSIAQSDESRLVVTTDEDDEDSLSNDSFGTVRGQLDEGWTRGSGAGSEPDTQLTARPVKHHRPVFSS